MQLLAYRQIHLEDYAVNQDFDVLIFKNAEDPKPPSITLLTNWPWKK